MYWKEVSTCGEAEAPGFRGRRMPLSRVTSFPVHPKQCQEGASWCFVPWLMCRPCWSLCTVLPGSSTYIITWILSRRGSAQEVTVLSYPVAWPLACLCLLLSSVYPVGWAILPESLFRWITDETSKPGEQHRLWNRGWDLSSSPESGDRVGQATHLTPVLALGEAVTLCSLHYPVLLVPIPTDRVQGIVRQACDTQGPSMKGRTSAVP